MLGSLIGHADSDLRPPHPKIRGGATATEETYFKRCIKTGSSTKEVVITSLERSMSPAPLVCVLQKKPELNFELGQATGTEYHISTRCLMKAGSVIFPRKSSTFVRPEFYH